MINIDNAIEDDLHEILMIYNEIIVKTTAVFDYEPHTLKMRKEWFKSRKDEGFPVFVAKENDQILGFSSIGPFRKWGAYQYTVENSVYVRADWRGKGIGRLLLSPLLEAAKQLNKHTVIAGIDATNKASIALHTSFGFEEVACFKEVGYKFGKWLDLKFLQCMLAR